MTRHVKWDARRLRRLREMWAGGLGTAEIAEALHVSKSAVCGKVRRARAAGEAWAAARSPEGVVRRPWTVGELRRVARLWAQGWSLRRIGADVGRSPNAVHGAILRAREAGASWALRDRAA